jgi:hypothetical protein
MNNGTDGILQHAKITEDEEIRGIYFNESAHDS